MSGITTGGKERCRIKVLTALSRLGDHGRACGGPSASQLCLRLQPWHLVSPTHSKEPSVPLEETSERQSSSQRAQWLCQPRHSVTLLWPLDCRNVLPTAERGARWPHITAELA